MIGRQVTHFYMIRMLGSGGMGVVYEAQDTRLPRSVAVKFLKPALAKNLDALRRFKREARLASSLNHPNICTILEVDEDDGQTFIVMELLQGRSLKSRIAAGPVAVEELVDIARQIADALAIAHGQGIIHRDITPGNVFLTDTGLVKLLDFGLAKYFPSDEEGESTEGITAPGTIVGTIHYMAPEQLIEGAPLDYRCDLFSLGAVLYEMATGAPPFDLSPRSALVAMIREQPYVPARQLVPGLPLELEGILASLLAKSPADRYQSARELHDDLGTIHTRPAAAVNQARPGVDRGSLAVLPFEIVGEADEEIERFRDGLTEDLASQLGALPGLRVAPRTSVRSVAGLSIDEIGQRLAVERVLEGTIQHAGDRVRVTANLVDAAQQRSTVPPVRIDRRREDRFAMQDAVARAIGDGLTLALSRAPSRYTPEPDAAHAFRRGLHHWHHCFSGGWRRAIEHFEYAIDRDPEFADAHVALANAYNFVGFYCLMKPRLSFSVAARSADRALAIDSGLASAHRERALATFGGEWDWTASEAAFRSALALDPDDALAHVYYSWLLILLGREDAALAEAQRAQALAPGSRLVATARAQTLFIGERYEEALEICRECLRADPAYLFAVHLSGLCQLALSGGPGAVADLERAATISNRAPYYLGLLGRCYGQFGLRTEALALVDELQRQSRDTYVAPQCYVYIYAGLKEREQALAYQESAYLDGAPPFNYLAPTIRDLYALDPYHKSRLEQMRLAL